MTTGSKQRTVTRLLNHVGKSYDDTIPKNFNVLDHLLIGVLQEDVPFSTARSVYENLLQQVFNLNELRVSHPREMEDWLGGLPHSETKAKRVLDILRFVFETTYSFDLDSMKRKPLNQARKQLSKITGATSFAVAATVQRSLGGHALPIDQNMLGLLSQLALTEEGETLDQVRANLETVVPKSKGVTFCVILSELAADPERRDSTVQTVMSKNRRKTDKDDDAEDLECDLVHPEPEPEPDQLELASDLETDTNQVAITVAEMAADSKTRKAASMRRVNKEKPN